MRLLLPILVLLIATAAPALAQLPQIRLDRLFPPGGRVGTAVEVTVEGEHFEEVRQVRGDHPGLKAEFVREEGGKVTFRLAVAPDTPVGTHDLRAVGRYGISNSLLFEVTDGLTEVVESEPNDSPEQANRVPLNAVISGTTDGSAEDYFVWSGRKGQRVIIDGFVARLGSNSDATLAILTSSGKELAANRNFNGPDPLIDFTVPEDGDTIVKFWDFNYSGNQPYRLRISTLPHLDALFPLAAPPGSATTLTLYGRNLPGGADAPQMNDGGPLQKLAVTIPIPAKHRASQQSGGVTEQKAPVVIPSLRGGGAALWPRSGQRRGPGPGRQGPSPDSPESRLAGFHPSVVGEANDYSSQARNDGSPDGGPPTDQVGLTGIEQSFFEHPSSMACILDGFQYRLATPAGVSNPLWVTFARDPIIEEREPNNGTGAAQELSLPCEIDGSLERPGDEDWFAVTLKAGQALILDAACERLGMRGDLYLLVQNAKGEDLEEFDDSGVGYNQRFTTTNRDPIGRFTAQKDGKYYLLVADRYQRGGARFFYHLRVGPPRPDYHAVVVHNTENTPSALLVRQGGSQYDHLIVLRHDDFDGEISYAVEGLPPGVTAASGVLGPGVNIVPLVVTAAPDAPPVEAEYRVRTRATIDGKRVEREARPVVQSGNNVNASRLARDLVLAVRPSAPYALIVSPERSTVAPGGTLELRLSARRHWPQFKGSLQVTAIDTPPEFTVPTVDLPADQTETVVRVTVGQNAKPGTYTLVLRGDAQVPFTKNPDGKDKSDVRVTDPGTPVQVVVMPPAKTAETAGSGSPHPPAPSPNTGRGGAGGSPLALVIVALSPRPVLGEGPGVRADSRRSSPPPPAMAVALRPDGKVVATGLGSVVKLRDAASGALSGELTGHRERVYSLAFSPDGARLAVGGYQEVRLWDPETGKLLRALPRHAHRVVALAFSPDGKVLAAAGGAPTRGGEVKLWDAATGRLMATLTEHSDTVYGVAFSPDGARLLTASADRNVKLWDLATKKVIRTLAGHTHYVFAVAFSPDGKRAASAGGDNAVKLWDLETGEPLRSIAAHGKQVWVLAFSPDGKWLASGGQDAAVKLWDPENGNELRSLGGIPQAVLSLSVSKDGATLAVGAWDGATRLFNAADGQLVKEMPAADPTPVKK